MTNNMYHFNIDQSHFIHFMSVHFIRIPYLFLRFSIIKQTVYIFEMVFSNFPVNKIDSDL